MWHRVSTHKFLMNQRNFLLTPITGAVELALKKKQEDISALIASGKEPSYNF